MRETKSSALTTSVLLQICPNRRSCTHWSKRLRRQTARRSRCWPQLLIGLPIAYNRFDTGD